jgi:ParB family chromosome partitioning protein
LGELIDKVFKADSRQNFTPPAANLFGRVGGPYLIKLWCDLLGPPEDHPTATTFAKLKKSEKDAKIEALFCDPEVRSAHRVTEAQVKRVDTWLPEGMD